jgi:hypothetical protein
MKVSRHALWTLKLTLDEGVRMSYLVELRACVDAGLVVFDDNGRGAPRLTDTGRAALASLEAQS